MKEANETKKPVNWKAWGALAACFAVAVAAIFVVPMLKPAPEEPVPVEPEEPVGGMIGNVLIPNPFVDCATMDEGAEKAGFSMAAPETIENYSNRTIRVMVGSLFEVQYRGETAEGYYSLRKATGEDPRHGDYNVYNEEKTVTVGTRNVTMKGNDGKFSLAYWTEGGYALSVSTAAPITEEQITAIIAQMG